MSRNDLEEAQRDIFRSLILNKNYERRMKSKINKFPHLKKSYDEYLEFLEQKGVLK